MPLEAIGVVQRGPYIDLTPWLVWFVTMVVLVVFVVKNNRHRGKWHAAENRLDRANEQWGQKITKATQRLDEISATPAKAVTVKVFEYTDPAFLDFLWKVRGAPEWAFFMADIKQSLYQGIIIAESQALVENVVGKIKGLQYLERALEKVGEIREAASADVQPV